jgi:selenocysteine-specific elongation factor
VYRLNDGHRPFVVGTAGHIDHGKSTLARALTGVDPDRLAEEKRRGITIVLGFAPLPLPSGMRASLVDVPGHERFVRTMAAGAGGVDVGLLVVSAEDGVMPQTREHLDILRWLGVPRLVVALTRCDAAEPEVAELADLDVRELIATSPWPSAPVVRCSGRTGFGLDALRDAIAEAGRGLPPAPPGEFRLPVDRCFTVRGFGTVVTGTVRAGTVQPGDTVDVLPAGVRAKVRGVQVHGEDTRLGAAGMRLALNLQGLDVGDAPPGSWLARPGTLACAGRIDVALALGSDEALPNGGRVRVLHGAAERIAEVRLVDPDGGPVPEALRRQGLAQLVLDAPLCSAAGDRFVLRAESPMRTIGGGTILDPDAPMLDRRARKHAARAFASLASGDATSALTTLLTRSESLDGPGLRRRLPPGTDVAAAAAAAVSVGDAVSLSGEPASWASTAPLAAWTEPATAFVSSFHAAHPLLPGPLPSELRLALRNPPNERVWDALLPSLLDRAGLVLRGSRIARADHVPEPQARDAAVLATFVERLESGGAHPPPLDDAANGLDLPPDALTFLVATGRIVRVADDFYVGREAFRTLVRALVRHVETHGMLTPQDFKAIADLSRRHALPFLEFLDRERILQRRPEGRVLLDPPDWAR